MRGVNTREDEPGGDRLACGVVAEGDCLRLSVASRRSTRRSARACGLVAAGPARESPWASSGAPRRRPLARTPSWLARPTVRTRSRPDAGDHAARCSPRRRDRRAPVPWGHPSQPLARPVDPELRLGLEHNLIRDLRLTPPLLICAPVLREIQRPPQRHRPAPADCVHRNTNLTVTRLPQRPRVLALDTRRVFAVLRKPGVIQHPRLHIDLARHALGHRLDHQRRVPRTVSHKLLQRLIVSVPAQPLDHRLKRLTRTLLQKPPQIQGSR